MSDIKWGGVITSGTTSTASEVYSKGNEIYFNSAITFESINNLIKEVQNCISLIISNNTSNYSNNNEIELLLFIDSNGGCVSSAFKFIDFINIIKSKGKIKSLTTIITGKACSSGTLLALVGDKRYITKNAYCLLHELSAGIIGTYTMCSSYIHLLNFLHKRIVELYMTISGLSIEEIQKMLLKETWFTSEEYLALGLVDEIYV